MNSAVFLDRDGVIIQNREKYVRCWNDVEFLPTSIHALKLLSQTLYKIIIITNQSMIGRGIITMEQFELMNHRIIEEITDAGGRIDGVFICPHTPDDHCLCRKPMPGLILQAAEALSIDLPSSTMIGDALTDIQAGFMAGINTLILVKTGRGQEQYQLPRMLDTPHFLLADHLLSATKMILSKSIE